MKGLIHRTILLVLFACTCVIASSCSKATCYTPEYAEVFIYNYDSLTGDTAAIVENYTRGSDFSSFVASNNASIVAQPNSSFAIVDFLMMYDFDYIFTFLPSGIQHKVQNMSAGNYSHTRGPLAGEAENCTNSFSCVLDGDSYYIPMENYGHSNNTGSGI